MLKNHNGRAQMAQAASEDPASARQKYETGVLHRLNIDAKTASDNVSDTLSTI